jgi:hypothetical protein
VSHDRFPWRVAAVGPGFNVVTVTLGGLDVAGAAPWNATVCWPTLGRVFRSELLGSKRFGSGQNRADPNWTPLPVYENDISVGLFLPGRHRLLIHLSGRRNKPRHQVELVPGNGIFRRQRKRSGPLLRSRHEGISSRERLQHQCPAQSIMPSQRHDVGLFWFTEIEDAVGGKPLAARARMAAPRCTLAGHCAGFCDR